MTNSSEPSPDLATDAPGDRLSLLEIAEEQMAAAIEARTRRLAQVEPGHSNAETLLREIGMLTLWLSRIARLAASRDRAGAAADAPGQARRRNDPAPTVADRQKAAVGEEPVQPVAPTAPPADPPAARPQADPAALGRLAHHPRDEHGRRLIDPRYSIRPPDPSAAVPPAGG